MSETKFDYSVNYKTKDLRAHPELYKIGRGEQGVLLVEPYKSEILPFWKFKTPTDAKSSARIIYKMFLSYGKKKDFVGMDMARKFLQMGFTRSMRYANHSSGKKYLGPVPVSKRGQSGSHGRTLLPKVKDPIKKKSAEIFKKYLDRAKKHKRYNALKSDFVKAHYG